MKNDQATDKEAPSPIPAVVDWRGMIATRKGGCRIVLIDVINVGNHLEKALIEETAKRRQLERELAETKRIAEELLDSHGKLLGRELERERALHESPSSASRPSEEVAEEIRWLKWQAEMMMAGDDKFAHRCLHIAEMIERLSRAASPTYVGEKP